MEKKAKIYIAGHRGMLGGAIWRELQQQGYTQLLGRTRAELDLTNQMAVIKFFQDHQPEYVFLAAAKVGGILANSNYPGDFIFGNLMIQSNIIHAAKMTSVKRLLFLGSSCIYPRDCPQPIKESYLLSSPLEKTNRPYAVAKISGIEMCWAYYRQFGCRFLAAMPTNLYGPGDHYDRNNSHVLPGLIRKCHEAKTNKKQQVVLWGTGFPRREFLYCEDAAKACVYLLNLSDTHYNELFTDQEPPVINVGYGQDLTIAELAKEVANVVGFQGDFVWDISKPDGTPQKLCDVKKLNALGWRAETTLEQGIQQTYHDYQKRLELMTLV